MTAARSVGNIVRTKARESAVLDAVLTYLNLHRDVAWAKRMNSGAAKLKGFFVRFGFVGCSDILGHLKDGRFLAVECKAEDGQLTKEQREFLDQVRRHNGVAGTARSIEGVDALLGTKP